MSPRNGYRKSSPTPSRIRNIRLDEAITRLERLGENELAEVVRDLSRNVAVMEDMGGFLDRGVIRELVEVAPAFRNLTPALVEQLADVARTMRQARGEVLMRSLVEPITTRKPVTAARIEHAANLQDRLQHQLQ